MDALTWAGVAAGVLAVGLVVALLLVPSRPRVELTRLDPTARPVPHGWSAVAVAGGRVGDGLLVRLGRRDALVAALERAGVQREPAHLLAVVLVGAVAGGVLGGLAGGVLGGLLLTPVVPVGVVVVLRARARRRRVRFADQLEDTLRLMASSLRAGHSVLRSLEVLSQEADHPTAEEFARVLNEVRVGRDLVAALGEVSLRTGSDDFGWVAQAVSIHREVGGNLAEVLDRVGSTIRDRGQLRRQARALSAEGRASAVVLLGLPLVLGGGLALVSPAYMGQLTAAPAGLLLLGIAGLLMVVGAVWVRRVVTVRF
ncbi:type II secretion system F family protein [Modestobacter sp. VKM Ac-2985]|uniref:type II secretion system F family protein n=1 Tax=Modestobacter sp. VKM Ac-2985 TaxID=3004139 RepID=UPI0022AB86A6|nr:type II secretion system F family protein [Modestobacter sp. VKM Ac-2985]MCZ2836806.1 type II secretion system F family protein [Modestobacter sp. VKM Ac-2985]